MRGEESCGTVWKELERENGNGYDQNSLDTSMKLSKKTEMFLNNTSTIQ